MGLRDKHVQQFPIVAAHRGATRFAPENTLRSFAKALELGAKAIELDVQMTADHQIVVIHDLKLERTTTGTGRVADKTLAYLRSLDAGAWYGQEFAGERIPLLDEVLSLVRGRALVNIELKPTSIDDTGFESRVVDIVRNHGMQDDVFFMSFDHVAIQRVKRLAPNIPGLVTCGCRLANEMTYLKGINADGSNHSLDWWTPDSIDEFIHTGLIVHASLINSPEAWSRACELGVDMVDSDEEYIYGSPSHSSSINSITSPPGD